MHTNAQTARGNTFCLGENGFNDFHKELLSNLVNTSCGGRLRSLCIQNLYGSDVSTVYRQVDGALWSKPDRVAPSDARALAEATARSLSLWKESGDRKDH